MAVITDTAIRHRPRAGEAAHVPGHAPQQRDRSIDILRVGCIALVVLLHALMVGVTVADGAPVFENALEQPWFAPVSWLVQMMPLFFIAGGVTALGSWRRAAARGDRAASFAGARVQRLLRPFVVVMAATGAGLAALSFAGLPGDVVAEAGFRVSQPLWFLGVFVLVQTLVPAMAALHERAAWRTLGALVAAVVAVDAVRVATGMEGIGFLNLAFVWLTIQQLGFWLADGRMDRLSPWTRGSAAAAALGALALLTSVGPYSPDMYVNLNPPTLALVLLGVAHVMLFSLARPWLRRTAEGRRTGRVVDAVGARAMTIYLWHMPVLIVLAGISVGLSLGGSVHLPELHSAGWWLSRPVWLLVAVIAVAATTALACRGERKRGATSTAHPVRAAVAAVIGTASIAIVFVMGLSWWVAALSVLFAVVAVRLAGDYPRRKGRGGTVSRAHVHDEDGSVITSSSTFALASGELRG